VKRFGIILLLLAACAQPQKQAAQPSFRALGETLSVDQTRSDEAVGVEVRRQIDLVGPAASAGIIVQVSDGVVTLSGTAPSVADSWRAQGAAQTVKGVKNVINEIVSPNLNPAY
jgi:osmotically-inducible protein OsmY